MEKVRFGAFHLDLAALELRRDGQVVVLQQQPMQLLAYLVCNAGRLVSRKELQHHLWGDRHVDAEQGLNNVVRQVRRALEDRAEKPVYLETTPRLGYRFIAPVEEISAPPPKGRAWIAAAVGAVLLTAVLLLLGVRPWGITPEEPPEPIRLAVLPVRSLEGADLEPLTSLLMEEILTSLANLDTRRLTVISRASMEQFTVTFPDVRAGARALAADYLVESSVRQEGEEAILLARLIRGESGSVVWGDRFVLETERSDAGANRVIASLVGALADQGLPITYAPEPPPRVENQEAWKAFLEARFLLAGGGAEQLQGAARAFRRVVTLAPEHAPGWLGLAEATWLLQGDAVQTAEVRHLAEKVLELSPQSGDAHLLLAEVALYQEWDPEAAEMHYRKALELSGGLAKPHKAYGFFLAVMGRAEAAREAADQALVMDPFSTVALGDAGWIYLLSRNYGEAIAVCQRALELKPRENAGLRWCLLDGFVALGRYPEARPLVQRWALEAGPEAPVALAIARASSPEGAVHAFLQQSLQRLEAAPAGTVPAGWMALAAGRAGETEKALRWLETAHRQRARSFLYWARSPVFDPLRTDPRYRALVEDSPLPLDPVAADRGTPPEGP